MTAEVVKKVGSIRRRRLRSGARRVTHQHDADAAGTVCLGGQAGEAASHREGLIPRLFLSGLATRTPNTQ